jgi:hypothetical protein
VAIQTEAGSQISSGSIVSDYGLDDRAMGFDPRQGQRIFLLSYVSRPAPGPTQAPLQWVPGVLSPGIKRGRGVMLTTQPYLVPRLGMSRSYTPVPQSLSMACSGTALQSEAGPSGRVALIAWRLKLGFESRSRHGYLSSSFSVLLSCVGRGLCDVLVTLSKESYRATK